MELFGPKSGRWKAPVLGLNTVSSCHEETRVHFKTTCGLCSCPIFQEEDQAATSLLVLVKASSFHSHSRQKFTGDLRVWGPHLYWRNLTQSCQYASRSFTPVHLHAAQVRGRSKFCLSPASWGAAHSDEFDVAWEELWCPVAHEKLPLSSFHSSVSIIHNCCFWNPVRD